MRESTFTNAICKAESKQINKDFAYCEDALGRAENAIGNLPPAQPEQRWIPWDSGRLPNDSGTYIVTAYDGAKERVTFAMYQKRLKRWELTGARAYWRVIAWMPLPEPYRTERRTDDSISD